MLRANKIKPARRVLAGNHRPVSMGRPTPGSCRELPRASPAMSRAATPSEEQSGVQRAHCVPSALPAGGPCGVAFLFAGVLTGALRVPTVPVTQGLSLQ